MAKYKVVNTTVKKPRVNEKGKDTRNWTEKLGHGVLFRNSNNDVFRVDPNRPRIVDFLNEGMLRLQEGGFIRIEEIEGVEDVLRKHTLNKEKNLSSVFTPDENAQGMVHASATPRPRATAVQMGDDKTVERGESHMINPDGNPNFVVTAGKDTKRKSKTEQPAPEAAPSEGATV